MKRLLFALAVIATTGGTSVANEISACGQTVPDRGEGVLVADLACPAAVAVTVGWKAKLLLDGHAIVGTVMCQGSCTITGPGDVSSGLETTNAIFVNGPKLGTVRVSDVTLHDSASGIGDNAKKLLLSNVVSSNNHARGIFLVSGRLRGSNVTTNDNGASGVYADGNIRLDQFTAMGNSEIGLASQSKRGPVLANSTLTGNQWSLGGMPVDLFSNGRPKVTQVTCDHSLGPNGPWGVCAAD